MNEPANERQNNGIRWAYIVAGFLLGTFAFLCLILGWRLWLQGPWADCPSYVFGQRWYPEPPPPVTLIPCVVSIFGFLLLGQTFAVSLRNQQRIESVLCLAGLAVNSLPIVLGFVIPFVSGMLNRTTPGY